MILHPETPHRVLHQVAHNPIGREQLRGGGDLIGAGFLRLAKAVHYLGFSFRDIKLVQPADDFHILTVIRGHGGDSLT